MNVLLLIDYQDNFKDTCRYSLLCMLLLMFKSINIFLRNIDFMQLFDN